MSPGDRPASVATAVAIALVLALLFAAGTAAGAPTVGDGGNVDDEALVAGSVLSIANDTDETVDTDSTLDGDDGTENDSTLLNGSDDGSSIDDGSTTDGGSTDDGTTSLDTDGDASADADGATLDTSVSLRAGNRTVLDANLSTSVDGDGIAVDLDATSDAGVSIGANATVAGSTDGNQSEGDDADGENRSAGATADGTDADGEAGGDGGDGLSGPEQAGAGLAIGAALVGGGLLARRFGEAATLAGGSGAGGTSVLSAAMAWLRAWGWRLLALAGYQRLDSSDPLEHETRAAVYEAIQREPGVFLAELQERTDVPMSTLRYHLRILAFEDLIDSEKVRGKRRYLPREVEADALGTALAEDATAAVLEAVAREPDSVSGLADRLDRDPSTVTHHLERLDEEGLVERERDGRSVVTRLADGVDRTAVVLATPSPAD